MAKVGNTYKEYDGPETAISSDGVEVDLRELHRLNSLIRLRHLDRYWSGCNRNANEGKNEFEPKGTCSSLHVCTGCDKLELCTDKKTEPIWVR